MIVEPAAVPPAVGWRVGVDNGEQELSERLAYFWRLSSYQYQIPGTRYVGIGAYRYVT